MRTVFRCRDQWGREVILSRGCWHGHILGTSQHLELQGFHESVKATITNPEAVNYDVDYDAATRQVENYYRRFKEGPPSFRGAWVKVCVEFKQRGFTRAIVGHVVTAYATNVLKAGEKRKWPLSNPTSST